MRVLFSMRHTGALRNFASTLQALAERNHQVHLVFGQRDKEGDERLLQQLARDFPDITFDELGAKAPWRISTPLRRRDGDPASADPGSTPRRRRRGDPGWLGLARAVRYTVDYLRYFTPEYGGVSSLKQRARDKAPALMRRVVELPIFRSRRGNRALTRALLAVERAIPVDRAALGLVESHRPDVLLVTPLVDIGSDQVDYVKAARRLGVRSALPVLSWDNLTNKGLIRVQPHKVFVWNEAQKREAVEMHGLDPADVVVTGAMAYDQWFARRPSSTRESFCARVGLDPSKPILLYLCSSPFIAPDELNFIEQWIAAVRGAPDPRVRSAGILIRPHPENRQPWYRFEQSPLENVAIWPRGGASPIDAESRNDFFDSMYHAAAAVGINTSAQIECGIVGRPVLSIRTPEYQQAQDGTLHFRYLTTEGGGLLRLADDFATHVRQITETLDDPEGTRRGIEGFVRAFTRPHGLDIDATSMFVDALEAFAASPAPLPERTPIWAYPLRAALFPVAVVMDGVRRLRRLSRKRERQLRPLTIGGTVLGLAAAALRRVLRAGRLEAFAKRQIVPRLVSRLAAIDAPTEEAVAVASVVHRIGLPHRPVIVGPWVSEIGYELLYWIPFLHWVRSERQFSDDQLVIVSRGGCRSWYGEIASRYVELFDYYTPEQFYRRSEQRITDGRPNPRTVSEFDRNTIKLVRQRAHLADCDLLHPVYMYRLFQKFWQGLAPADSIERFSVVKPLPRPDASVLAGRLPDDYVAVRFSFNEVFPDTESNRRFVHDLLCDLTADAEVVVLGPSMPAGDHRAVPMPARGRMHDISHLTSARTNLEIQSAVIAGARAFVGTHGGLSYLPPLYGVRSLSFYSDPRPITMRHVEVARRAFATRQPGSYVALDVKDLDTLRLAFGGRREAIASLTRQR